MSDEYPKALYRGDSKTYEHVIADGEEHEQHLREQGYVNYAELKEPEVIVIGKASGSSGELNKVKQELLEALQTIEQKDEKILDLQSTFIAENNKLRQQIRQLELSKLDAGEIRKILDEKQVKYGARDSKDELVKLVFDAEYPIFVDPEEE
ncbi:hypothetical protein [Acinetobacter sp. ANC 3882]|uniref:hypothetical protein n=1 Tax=Acinetobacter sp. ANC 3882 TaxID=2923423 RepID=UPI001F4B49A4|nr:hypothetical protein [Acinetobacter sp. ANC 3882]MCH7312903.1 hypothetical protein [Acinetobacter sp. ANC 3882]